VRQPVALAEAPGKVRLQPHVGWALLLTVGMVGTTLFVQIAWEVAGYIYAASVVGEATPEKMAPVVQEFGRANAELILLSLFGTSLLGCLGVVTIAFGRQLLRRLSMRRCTGPQLAAVLMVAVPLAVVVMAIVATLFWLMDATNSADQINEPGNLALVLLAFCVGPAIGEEMFFRGFVSRGLIARHGVIFGVILATLLFAMAHVGAVQVFGIFFMGLVVQLVFLWTRSLPACMLLHGVYNAIVVLFSRNVPASLEVLEAVFVPMVATSLIALSALGVVLYQSRTRWLLPDGSPWPAGQFATEMPPQELRAIATSARPKALPLVIATLSFAALVAMAVLVMN
jgi:membrane protease YdiL (CAAX protease family)